MVPSEKDEADPAPVQVESAVKNAKEKRRRNLRVKKRSRDSDDSGDDGQHNPPSTSIGSLNPKGKAKAMIFTTKNASDKDSKGFHTFESSGMEASARVDDATRTVEDVGVRRLGGASHVDNIDGDTRGNRGNHSNNDTDADRGVGADTKAYRGMQNYTDYRQNFRAEAERAGANISERKQQAGPARPSANYRMTVLVDYQPDVCKDYKETGFCGFGDSCKFLHDRSDYKAGWQLDRDWDEAQKALKANNAPNHQDPTKGEDDGSLPFACLICKEPWTSSSCADPVVTKCGHYFCEACALKQNAKTGKCFTCGKSTRGIFNSATDIIKRFKK